MKNYLRWAVKRIAWLKKYAPLAGRYSFWVGLGAVLGFNLAVRSYPVNFPQFVTLAREQAQDEVYRNASAVVKKQFANLSEPSRRTMFDALVKQYHQTSGGEFRQRAREKYQQLRDPLQDKTGQTYLMELDCWHWARYVENVYRSGHPGDRVVDGRQQDMLMTAPWGSDIGWTTCVFYLSAFLFRLASFAVHVPLNTFLFYLPLFFIAVFITALFWLCRRFYGTFAAVTASLVVGMGPIFVPRSCAGWFDMDILQLLLPLLCVFGYLMAYEKNSSRSLWFWAAVSSLLLGLFSWIWPYWWFIGVIILVYELYTVLDLFSEQLQYKEDMSADIRRHAMMLLVFAAMTVAWVLVFSGPQPFRHLITQFKDSLLLNDPLRANIWPNVYSTVGELRRPDLREIIKSVGGMWVFLPGLVAMLVLILHNRRFRGLKREMLFMMLTWFMVMLLASFKGVRLTMFLLIPLGVVLGWGIQGLLGLARRKKKVSARLTAAVAGACLVFWISLIYQGNVAGLRCRPLMDDDWYDILQTIRENTPQEAIINSWWDYGDWFKSVARRRVIFDGHSQNIPQAYWMARVFLADSEEKALRILRMLNNSGNRVFEIIDSYVRDPFESVRLVEKALELDTEQVRRLLSGKLPAAAVEQVCAYLFNKPPAAYFVAEYSLMDKIEPISFIGNWDFSKVYLVKNFDRQSKPDILSRLIRWGMAPEKAEEMYQDFSLLPSAQQRDAWVSRRLRFYTSWVSGRPRKGLVLFENGLVYTPAENAVFGYNAYQSGFASPRNLLIWEDNKLTETSFSQPDSPTSILIMRKADEYTCFELDPELARCFFTRLYLFNGAQMRHFKPFAEHVKDNRNIRVFEIIWD